MKTVGLSAFVAGVLAWVVVAASGTPEPTMPYDAFAMDLEDRLSVLEGRLARIESPSGQPLLKAQGKSASAQGVEARLEQLEERLARVDRGGAQPESGEKIEQEASRQAEQGRAEEATVKALFKQAMKLRGSGSHEAEEEALKKVIESFPDAPLAKEAAYQIGWSRNSRGDHEGAREAWLGARDQFPRGHWRRDYARFYAASSAVEASDKRSAERELEDLINDIESDRTSHAQRKAILERSKRMLDSLRD